jgi:cytochrome c556
MKLKPTIRVGALAGVSLCLLAASPSVKESMKSVVEPTTNVLFAVGGEVDPANGPDAAKVSDARWQEAAVAAGKLKFAAAALLQPDQAKPGADWTMSAKQLGDLADTAEKAAKAKDGAKLADTANALGDNCTACHSKYKPQAGG